MFKRFCCTLFKENLTDMHKNKNVDKLKDINNGEKSAINN
jgi:hypothetical protein